MGDPTIHEATFTIDQGDLLTALWFPDGSGANSTTVGLGIEDMPDRWCIHSIDLRDDGQVLVTIVRADNAS